MTKAKTKERLTPIPKRRETKAIERNRAGIERPAPDLSKIAPQLRALAVPVDSIEFYPGNPRQHDDAQIQKLRGSLREFGQMTPLTVNTSKSPPQVVKGNGTLQAALAEGWQFIAVHGREMTDQEAAAYIIADNETSELSPGWDKDALEATMRLAQTADQELAGMFTELAERTGITPPDFQPVGIEEQGQLDQKAKVTCPECGHEFTP